MTKCELLKALERYDNDKEVFITLPGARTIFYVDMVNSHSDGSPVLETEEAPDFGDLVGMAAAHYEEYHSRISVVQEGVGA